MNKYFADNMTLRIKEGKSLYTNTETIWKRFSF